MSSDDTYESVKKRATSANGSDDASHEPADRSQKRNEQRRRKAAGKKNRGKRGAASKSVIAGEADKEKSSNDGKQRSGKTEGRKQARRQRKERRGARDPDDVGAEDSGDVKGKPALRAARRRARKGATNQIAEFVEPVRVVGRRGEPSDPVDETSEFTEEESLDQSARDNELDTFAEASSRSSAIDSSRPVSISILASDLAFAQQLFRELQRQSSPSEIEFETGPADVVIDLHNWRIHGHASARGDKATIIVAGLAGDAADQQKAANIARSVSALVLPLEPILRRHGHDSLFDGEDALNDVGAAVLARAVVDVLNIRSRLSAVPIASDLEQALAFADDPARLLKALSWPGSSPPRAFGLHCRRQTVEDFLDGKIRLSRKDAPAALSSLISGNADLPASAASSLYSMTFVSEALTYWLAKANRVSSTRLGDIDSVLKTRNITASELLVAAGETLARVASESSTLPEAAWQLRAMESRAFAFETFLLCCRTAAARKIRFEQSHCGPVWRGLLELLERLRPTALHVGAASAVNQLSKVTALALPIRKMAYGAALLTDATEWLSEWEIDAGMSGDGVWQEGLAQHGSVITTLSTLIGDLREAEVSIRSLSAAITKLARFVDAILAEGGACPPIDELPGAAYPKLQKTARAILKKSAAAANLVKQQDGSKDIALFKDSGYFLSRSTKEERRPRSHLVLHVRQPQQGGPSLSFSIDGRPLLIGGGTMDAQAAPEIRRASRIDPAAHNTLRIDGQTYAAVASNQPSTIRIDAVWDRPDWAAVRTLDDTFDAARLARTVIHLKPGHALLVLDEMEARSGETEFEQFWHFSPSLHAVSCVDSRATFTCEGGGVFHSAFDAVPTLVLSHGGTGAVGWTSPQPRKVVANPYVVRARPATNAVMVAFFQWRRATREFEIAAEGGFGSWHATVTTAGATLSYKFAAGELQLVD